ncbi:helix-turn-helix transcriptional regulator [Demequina capsici]|uniref:Helix-turn-helix transcriptional regulator n=1 Tax=Demequina capsici TaxID=3075620 RepID=A0AA96F6R1_9MICO|nr:helix-turn-helix transcriptional regulator [Demequina sp. OYTSA14]WNM25101.1 helix-turn-helix transcriptional regulator [Demequina sp. OYTSA14]
MDLPELGAFLRSRRDRITPEQVGIVPGPRRRVPGLRRDEVAMLAGASVEYYIELEQGSKVQPSPQMLAALSRALRLTGDERNHLYRLAGRPVPARTGDTHVEPAMLALLDRLDDTPALIVSDLAESLVANDMARALLGERRGLTWPRTSQVYRWFVEDESRDIHPPEDHARLSESLVADLRLAAGRRAPDDARLRELVELCTAASDEFTRLWEERTVKLRRVDAKVFLHPSIGTLDLLCHNLHTDDGSQHLLWFTAREGTDSGERLALLRVVGAQSMTAGDAR